MACNSNFDGVISSESDVLTQMFLQSDFLVKCGLVTIRSCVDCKSTFAVSGIWSFSTLSFPKPYSSTSPHLFIVVCSLNGSEAGGDLVLIKTSLLLLCETSSSYAN